MAAPRPSRPKASHRQEVRSSGFRQALRGCLIFGAGVAVGALLWPLARSKGPALRPPRPARTTTAAPKQTSAGGGVLAPGPEKAEKAENAGKAEPLTFFQTLKEAPSPEEPKFVPFQPTGDAPPPLEALAPKEVEPRPDEAPGPAEEAPGGGVAPEAAGGARYYVQVASFQYEENARRLTGELRRSGYPVRALDSGARSKPHRVRVGPFGSRQEADSTARRLEKTFLYPTLVVKETKP